MLIRFCSVFSLFSGCKNSILLIPLDAKDMFLGEKGRMDRIDKVLLILPLLPAADLLSTLFSLSLGGEEVGILARPILEYYGTFGLFMLAITASIIFLVSMEAVIYIRRLFINEWNFRWTQYVVVIPIYWFFILEGVYVSTVIMNFLVPLSPLLTQTILLKAVLVCSYFVCVSALTMPQMRQLSHF